jgi:hypothetical protein
MAGWRRRNTPYEIRQKDPEFAALWEEALQVATDVLEHEARERAMGWDEPVFDKDGNQCGTRRVYSDRMMELLLKAHRPEKFREKFEHDVTHQGGVIMLPRPMTAEEWEEAAFREQRPHREGGADE